MRRSRPVGLEDRGVAVPLGCALSAALAPLMDQGGSILTLDFDNSTQAWPSGPTAPESARVEPSRCEEVDRFDME